MTSLSTITVAFLKSRWLHNDMAEGPWVPGATKKYPVVLPYVKWISGQLRRVFRSFDIPAYFKLTNTVGNYWYGPRTG